MKQSEQARREDLLDSQRNEQKLVQGVRPDGHWPDGQHAPIKDQGFDRSHEGAPRADDRSSDQGEPALVSLQAPSATVLSKVQPDSGADNAEQRGGDQLLKEAIHQRLVEHPDLDLHDLSVALRLGQVTLEGSVPDAQMKEVIVELVDNVSGVLSIDDRISVQHVNPANHATAQAYAVGGQVGADLQHSGPTTFGAASATAAATKQQHDEGKKQAPGQGSDKDAKS